jgi:hypothetical protein
MLEHKRVLVYCGDCRRTHREVFDIPGTRNHIIRDFKRVVKQIDQRLTKLFGKQ